MENYYLLLVIVLFVLSLSDLIVGVSIDALNFLNTTFSSQTAPSWLIFGVSGLGILCGVTFSHDMVEVARNGIFHPDQFVFQEIIVIFVAVILSHVLLLKVFSTLGLPVSTTVSVIFDLLGASVTLAVIKIKKAGILVGDLPRYINTDKALAIILGILASIAIAFIAGFLLQWLMRVIFTFKYQKKIRYWGSLYGGVLFTLITSYLVQGLKGISWLPEDQVNLLLSNRPAILLISFIGWTVLFQIIQLLWEKFDVLVTVILVGTFAVAVAFAGNDLVSFLGVPWAGFESFKAWHAAGMANGESLGMGILNQPVGGMELTFLAAGMIVFLSMLNSRETRSLDFVADDFPKLSEGTDKQGFFPVSRSIIRGSIVTASKVGKHINPRIKDWVNDRFNRPVVEGQASGRPSIDKLRAANVLVISSALIFAGTSFKLPLSTAYIIFMVALGTSLADRKWDRESAVCKVSGIISLIGSWFFNAFFAFIISASIVLLISAGSNITALILGIIAIIAVIRKLVRPRKRDAIIQEVEEFPEPTVKAESVLVKTNQDTSNAIIMISKAYFLGLSSFHSEDRELLGEIFAEIEEFNQRMRKLKANIFKIIQKLQQDSIETGHYYVQIIDYLREMAHSIKYIIRPLYEHLGNDHKPFSEEQYDELIQFSTQITDFLNYALHIIKESRFEQIEELIVKRQEILVFLRDLEIKQIRRIKKKETNVQNSVLSFTVMSESKNLLLQTVNLLKATRDFVSYTKS